MASLPCEGSAHALPCIFTPLRRPPRVSKDQVLLIGETTARGVVENFQTLTRFIMRYQTSDLLITLPVSSQVCRCWAAVKLTEAGTRLPEFPFPLRTQNFDTGNIPLVFFEVTGSLCLF